LFGLVLGELEDFGAVSTGLACGSIFLPISCKSLPTPVQVLEHAVSVIAKRRINPVRIEKFIFRF
jgi:hypothetical protein